MKETLASAYRKDSAIRKGFLTEVEKVFGVEIDQFEWCL